LTRRVLLKSLALLVALLGAVRVGWRAERVGKLFLVDGWVLTRADLDELDEHAG
jgi:hypothetical protein